MAQHPQPSEGDTRLRRFAPFLAAGLIGWIMVAAPHVTDIKPPVLIAAAAVSVLIVGTALLLPWWTYPVWTQLLPAMAWLVVVYLLREGAGGVGSGYSALYLLAVLWPALYAGRRELVVALVGYAVAQVVWIVHHQVPSQTTFAVLGTLVTGIVCFTVQGLVRRVSSHTETVEAINGVLHDLAVEEDLAAARRTLCAAAAELCQASVSVLYELDPDGGLIVTAAEGLDAGTPERLRAPAPALGTLRTGEQEFVTRGADPLPLGAASSLWQPVVRAHEPVGVLAVGWSKPLARPAPHVRVALSLLAEQGATVIERTRMLAGRARQLAELRELDRLKTDFVSSASHELRTPITSILGYLDVLTEGEAGPLTDEQRAFIEVADRNARRLQALVEDLLVVSRIESGRLELSVREIDLGALTRRVGEGFAPQLAQGDVTLHIDAPRRTVVRADERRIEQVLVNLLSNAIKFSHRGDEVRVRVGSDADTVRLVVADHGVGMSGRDQERLFEKFFRAETAVEHAIPGTGLGLAICKGIIDAHGGSIVVDSAVGRGTTVTVDLPGPPCEGEEEDHGQRARPAAAHGAGRR